MDNTLNLELLPLVFFVLFCLAASVGRLCYLMPRVLTALGAWGALLTDVAQRGGHRLLGIAQAKQPQPEA
jgi:hypothetical protein